MSDNSLKELLAVVEPKIRNIEENRVESTSLRSVHETMEELIEIGQNSYKEILDFYDQDFILKAIKIGNSNADMLIEKYKVSKYLLKSDNAKLQELPQFKESISYMEQLYGYLYGLNKKIELDYETKSEALQIQELLNKYYNLLNKDNIFIEDIDEFITFLDLNELDSEKRLDILIYINKCNIEKYRTINDIYIGDNINLSDIMKIIKNNLKLINLDYDRKLEQFDLDTYLENNIDTIEDSLLERKKYVVSKIKNLYDIKKYNEIIEFYHEYLKIIDLEKEFVKQKGKNKRLRFLFKNDKSLVRDYLEKTNVKYKPCIYKNLLDLETNNALNLPKMCYNNHYLYVKNEFVVKSVYTYIDDFIVVLGVLEKKEELEDFLNKNEYLVKEALESKKNIELNDNERNIILKDIKLEDLIISIDLNTLDINEEDYDGR
ncbi:MAG: hypothetical protein IKN63_03950 [Bacilli bacterium]|nr:hypothetical protein [Bacilli bacterium]